MEIYVQSAGVSQQQDYIWQCITETGQERVDEPILVKNFKGLLETEAPSILIARANNQLILLVTGMKSSQRKDYRDRTIRNSIALIAQDISVNEQKIRGIAVLALEGNLENKIDSAIESGGKWGFEVDYKKIEKTIEESLQTKNSNTGTNLLMIGKNTASNKETIADQLQENCLPKQTNDSEALVVVTGIKTEDTLKKAKVWRGLSDLVEKENLTKYEPPNSTQKFFPNMGGNGKANSKFAIKLILSLGAIGLIILYLWSQNFFNPITHIVQSPKPTAVLVAAISPDGEHFVTANFDDQLKVQNTQDKTNNTIENNASVKSVAISSDGKYVVTGNDTGDVQLWDATNKSQIEITTSDDSGDKSKHEKAVLSVAINASKSQIQIVSGGADGQVLLWEVNVNNGKGEASIEKLSK